MHILLTAMDKRIGALLVCLLAAMPASAQTIGVTTGINFDRLSDITLNEVEARFNSQTGWHVGVWIEFPIGPFGLRGGARYLDAGMLLQGLSDLDTHVKDDFDFNLVEFPFLATFSLGTPVLNPYVFAGPVMRITTGVDPILAPDLKTPSYAMEIGGGLTLSVGRLKLSPEVAYIVGVTSFFGDELTVGSVTLPIDQQHSLNSAMLRLRLGL